MYYNSVRGSGIQAWLSWLPLALKVSHEVSAKLLVGAVMSCEDSIWGREISF